MTRRARPKAFRRTASSKHSAVGCRCAPRPGAVAVGSGATTGWPSCIRAGGHPQQLALRGPLPTSHAGPDRAGEGRGIRACRRDVFTSHWPLTLARSGPDIEPGRGGRTVGGMVRPSLGLRSTRPALDRSAWLTSYLPAWSSRPASAATYAVGELLPHACWVGHYPGPGPRAGLTFGGHERAPAGLRGDPSSRAASPAPVGSYLAPSSGFAVAAAAAGRPSQLRGAELPTSWRSSTTPLRDDPLAPVDVVGAAWLSGVARHVAAPAAVRASCAWSRSFGKDLGGPSAEVGVGIPAVPRPGAADAGLRAATPGGPPATCRPADDAASLRAGTRDGRPPLTRTDALLADWLRRSRRLRRPTPTPGHSGRCRRLPGVLGPATIDAPGPALRGAGPG